MLEVAAVVVGMLGVVGVARLLLSEYGRERAPVTCVGHLWVLHVSQLDHLLMHGLHLTCRYMSGCRQDRYKSVRNVLSRARKMLVSRTLRGACSKQVSARGYPTRKAAARAV